MTATGICKPLLGGLVVSLVCLGCGPGGYGHAGGTPRNTATAQTGAGGASGPSAPSAGGFAWFTAKPPPPSWRVAELPSGPALPYPPSWRSQHSDPGTASAALRTSSGTYLGYLNLTPRQGNETLANWRSFRVDHNREEGDRQVRQLGSAASLRFRSGQGSCVKDSYVARTGIPYVEIACFIAGARASVVAIGAAPPSAWPRQAAVIERAIEGVRA